MNITHVVENLNRGGLERMVVDLACLQKMQGHNCQVVCLFETGTLATELEERGIAVHACHKRRGPDPIALWRLRRAVRKQVSDVLHTHNVIAHYQAVLATRGLGVRRVINTRHGMAWKNKNSGRMERLYRRALAATDVVVTVCRAARDKVVHENIVPRNQVRVVPNGIRLDNIRPLEDGESGRLRAELGLSERIRLIGTVGRLNRIKNQESLIRAFGSVYRQYPETALVLIGGGELRGRLEQCAQDEGVSEAVHFLGDRKDVPTILPELDLFVLSSVSEGYSMALLEACAASLPMIATRVGGNAEIVEDGETGMLVEPENQDALERAITTMLREPDRAAALGRAAWAWVQRQGSVETMAARYAALYRGEEAES